MKTIIAKIKKGNNIANKHVEPRLLKRLKIFFLIISIILGVVIHNIYLGRIGVMTSVVGIETGLIIGFVAGRMFKFLWNSETNQVILRLDKIGFIFLILYILVEIVRKQIFGFWFHGATLNAFSMCFLVGLLGGRLLSMVENIRKILTQERVTNHSKNSIS